MLDLRVLCCLPWLVIAAARRIRDAVELLSSGSPPTSDRRFGLTVPLRNVRVRSSGRVGGAGSDALRSSRPLPSEARKSPSPGPKMTCRVAKSLVEPSGAKSHSLNSSGIPWLSERH
jgi:hypothetical protein